MIQENYVSKISPRNKVFADKIRKFAKAYSIIGVLDVEGLPAPQFQRIRASLKKTAEVLIVKKNLIELVLKELEKTHPGISELTDKMVGVVGLVFTNDNPFTLYKFVQKNKSSAPAKAGSIAPGPIIVPAGPTGFAPGPIIGELGALKIKAGINAGKVEIKEDSTVAKEGDVITDKLAGVLSRLGIEPMEVGLNIKAIYEEGTIYNREILDVDEVAILNDLKNEALRCFKLSIGLEYYTKENIEHFVSQGSRDSLALGVGIVYPAAETIKRLVSKANSQMCGVAMALPEENRPAGLAVSSVPVVAGVSAANEEPKEEKKEEAVVDAAVGLGNLF
ncbi:MAG: 50S ribosomal protein L10 [Nanoarchaeota archaeon]|nr:50S ribosomal protein L10 [Nanoarchaeota archaeon]